MYNTLAPLSLRQANLRRFLNARLTLHSSPYSVLSWKDTEKLYHMMYMQELPVVSRYDNKTRKYSIVLLEKATQMVEDTKDFYVLAYDLTWDEAAETIKSKGWNKVMLFQTANSHS